MVLSLFVLLMAAQQGTWAVAIQGRWRESSHAISPPRSGHTAATDSSGRVWLFGGYAEEKDGKKRYVTNDLWCLKEDGWHLVQESSEPGPRLCSASCVVDGALLLFGGWDPETEGTGGTILDDAWSCDLETLEWTRLAPMPRGPVSRHVAVSTDEGVVVHTFRCTDSVLVYTEDGIWIEQRTKGSAPSSRGLHSAAAVGHEVVVFGGADKSGEMRGDVYALDTSNWTWRLVARENKEGPTPRAGSCASSINDTTFLVCCGAERGEEGGLNPRADLWALDVKAGTWTCLLDDGEDTPSVLTRRNAATLSGPLPYTPSGTTAKSATFALHGGWHPFRVTFDDTVYLDIDIEDA